ncbi:uncharacterized protein LOC124809199 [Hydra vulgaris]|uniref:uncharacterized protein LOC124809199 n=1 Tax=Hydra vulgaris TaxID=6087 RepID=UPI0032EA6A27
MSILDTCGFAKSIVLLIFKKKRAEKKILNENIILYKHKIRQQQYDEYNTFFNLKQFNIDYIQFSKNFPKIIFHMKILGKNKLFKNNVMKTFSKKKWLNLSQEIKENHSLINCLECRNDLILKKSLGLYPIKGLIQKIKAKKGGLLKKTIGFRNKIINKNDQQYLINKSKTFSNNAKVQKGNSLFVNISKQKLVLSVKKDIEKQLLETSVERSFAVPVSLRKRRKLRLHGGFESKSNAILRTSINRQYIEKGLMIKKDHLGSRFGYRWEKKKCLLYLENLPSNQNINFTSLAIKYNLHNKKGKIPGNAGQVIKELLKENGVDVAKFNLKSISTFNQTENTNNCCSKPRRRKRRLNVPGYKSISIPMEVSNKVLKDKLEQDIEKGKYRIEKLIVPKTFTKTVCKNNSLVTEEFLVSGRKLSIDDIRADMYENHKAFMRLTTDQEYLALSRETIIDGLKRIGEFNDDYENRSVLHLRETFKKFERTRHLMFWHDGSSLSNHGHILMLISVMYDKAIFFNNDEYYEKYGEKINIQAIVEKPFLYILARCPSNDEQLEYRNLRIEDIISLKYPIIVNNDIEIFDVLRIFKGDHPASQFESGQNKDGNFLCHGCSLFAPKAKSYSYSFQSLKQRVEKIFQTNLSKDNFKHGKIYLYKNLS